MDITPTTGRWVDAVMADFDEFLRDHASCEKKASGMALNIASHYPDKPRLLAAMADLAVEELTHYRQVITLLIERGVAPGPDRKDPYVRTLNGLVRQGPELYLLDRLLIAAVVERRGNERFALLADALKGDPLAAFYRAIATSEARHWTLFLDLARIHCPAEDVDARIMELIELEAAIVSCLPLRAALH